MYAAPRRTERYREPISRSVGASAESFDRTSLEHGFQRVEFVAACKRRERLPVRGAMREIGLEHTLDGGRRVFSLDVAVDLPSESLVGTEAAADMDVVALDGVAVLRDRHSGAEEPDVADIVLSAGIGAAREVDVYRAVELQPRLAPVRNVLAVALGVGERETAADIAGAGDETGANRGRLGRKAQRRDRRFDRADALGGNARDQQVLPHRQPDVTVAKVARDGSQPSHLVAGEPADRKHHADPVQVGLLLRMRAHMGHAVEG